MDWNSSVSKMNGYGLEGKGLIPGSGRDFPLCHHDQKLWAPTNLQTIRYQGQSGWSI